MTIIVSGSLPFEILQGHLRKADLDIFISKVNKGNKTGKPENKGNKRAAGERENKGNKDGQPDAVLKD